MARNDGCRNAAIWLLRGEKRTLRRHRECVAFARVRLLAAISRACARGARRSPAEQPAFRSQSDPRSERPAGAGWAALRQFRFRDSPLLVAAELAGPRSPYCSHFPRACEAGADPTRSASRPTRAIRLGGGWPPSPPRFSGIRLGANAGARANRGERIDHAAPASSASFRYGVIAEHAALKERR
jgi:hypothetical protein